MNPGFDDPGFKKPGFKKPGFSKKRPGLKRTVVLNLNPINQGINVGFAKVKSDKF